jgi:hypothetical protein
MEVRYRLKAADSGPRERAARSYPRPEKTPLHKIVSEKLESWLEWREHAERPLEEPDTALRPLRDLVVIDEIQRRPDLVPALRVLAHCHGQAGNAAGLGETRRERQKNATPEGKPDVLETTCLGPGDVPQVESLHKHHASPGLPAG